MYPLYNGFITTSEALLLSGLRFLYIQAHRTHLLNFTDCIYLGTKKKKKLILSRICWASLTQRVYYHVRSSAITGIMFFVIPGTQNPFTKFYRLHIPGYKKEEKLLLSRNCCVSLAQRVYYHVRSSAIIGITFFVHPGTKNPFAKFYRLHILGYKKDEKTTTIP